MAYHVSMVPQIAMSVLRYWKAVGILTMAKLLFGSFERKGPLRNSIKGCGRFKERMMSPCKPISPSGNSMIATGKKKGKSVLKPLWKGKRRTSCDFHKIVLKN